MTRIRPITVTIAALGGQGGGVLSDWIVGTGEGRVGDVDATVRRDADGLPFVPAKTLIGIWRDACEQVAGWLDGSGGGAPWQAWVDWIFGSQPDMAGDRTAVHADADEATRELVHHHEHPVAPEHDRLASKEVHAPQAVCGVSDER